jgi:LysR family glycine cleavage system transcriptional activator
MGPTALVANDLAAGRLIAPFPGVTLPSRGYHAYLPDFRAGDLSAKQFCQWLEEIGQQEIV